MHILLVDDNYETRQFYAMALNVAGHPTEIAANGVDALNSLQRQRFDAIVLDVEMPDMSGWKVLEAIQQMPSEQRIPVILFTAHQNPSSDAYARMLGAYILLRKPIIPASLLEVVQRAVDEHNASSERDSSSSERDSSG